MPRFIKEFAIAKDGTLMVDGEEFPWEVAPEITLTRNAINVTLLANAVSVEGLRFGEPEPDPAAMEAARQALRKRAGRA